MSINTTKTRVKKMKVNKIEVVAVGVVFAALSGAAVAAYQYWRKRNFYAKSFDKSKVMDITGKVLDVYYSGKENDKDRGAELRLQTDENEVVVHLAPAWYIDNQPKKIEAGETITVRGSKMSDEPEPLVIAEWVRLGKDLLRLRDESGHPVWDAWNGKPV